MYYFGYSNKTIEYVDYNFKVLKVCLISVRPFINPDKYGMKIVYPTKISQKQCDYYGGVYQNKTNISKYLQYFRLKT